MNPPGETGSGAGALLGSAASPHGVLPNWRVWGARSWVTVGVYLFLIVVLLALLPRLGEPVTYFLVAVLAVYLIRYLSVQYVLSEEALYANRLFGSRRIPLGSIRKIQLTSLRDISPVSWFGSWGWRSRMWSPVVGKFDSISTVHAGLMVYGPGVPVFISPADPERFGAELSRRVAARAPGVESPWAPQSP